MLNEKLNKLNCYIFQPAVNKMSGLLTCKLFQIRELKIDVGISALIFVYRYFIYTYLLTVLKAMTCIFKQILFQINFFFTDLTL